MLEPRWRVGIAATGRLAEALEQPRVGLVGHRAGLAHAPGEALGQHQLQGGRDQERVRPEVDQAGHGGGRVVGVQGRQHQVAGEGGLHRQLRGLLVPDLADQHHVRVLPEHVTQPAGERQADARIDLRLVHPG